MIVSPGFWRHEASGELAPAVERYLLGRHLSRRDVALMRAYLVQWVSSPVWDLPAPLAALDPAAVLALAGLRAAAPAISSRRSIAALLVVAHELGIDPL